jgi:hypothetical protein
MDVCPRFSVLCCPVQVEALRRADPPAKESYQMSNVSIVQKLNFWIGTGRWPISEVVVVVEEEEEEEEEEENGVTK